MAEFGVKATELSQPQEAGSRPIAPVQQPAGFAPDLSGLGGFLQGLVSKEKADPWKVSLDEFTKKNAQITQAQQTGEFTAAKAKIERNKLVTQYQVLGADSGWGVEYQKTLSQLVGYVQTGSGTAEADELVQAELKAHQELFIDAQKSGMFPNVSSFQDLDARSQQALLSAQQSIRFADAEAKRAADLRAEIRAANSETRAQASADRDAQEYLIKKQAIQALAPMMRDSYELVDANLGAIMRDSQLDDSQKMQTFTGVINSLRSQGYQMLQGDQQTYQNYNQALQDLEKVGMQMLDPKQRTEAIENEWKRRITEAKLWATEGQDARRAAGMAAVFPNSPALQMAVANVGLKYLNDDIAAGEGSKPLPSVVTGNIPAQKATFGTIREAVRNSMDGSTPGSEEKFNAAASTFAGTVKALSTFRAGQSNTMEYALEAIASPEYAAVVSKGKFNTRDGAEALQTLSDVYLPSFTNALRQSLEAPIGDTRYEGGQPSADNASLMQLVDFEVDHDGSVRIVKNISPEFRKGITASDVYIDTQVRNLQKSLEPRINQLIRAAAHLEGTTDYKAVFEKNAPHMLRGFYAPEQYMEQLKAQGYSGIGNVNNPANWRDKSGFPSNRNQDTE